jgi:hypothetical protein
VDYRSYSVLKKGAYNYSKEEPWQVEKEQSVVGKKNYFVKEKNLGWIIQYYFVNLNSKEEREDLEGEEVPHVLC